MVRLERVQRSARGLRGNGRRIRIQPHHGGARAGVGQSQPIQQRLLRDQHARLRIPQHEGKARRRVRRIQRQIRPARLENAQQPHNELQRALKAQPHNRLRTNPQAAQMLRKLVRPPIKLPVAQPPPLKHNRRRIRPLARLRRKQARQAPRQNLPPGRVPPRQDALALLSPKQFQPPERTIRMRNRTRHTSRPSRPASPSTVPRSNKSAAYSISPTIPPGAPSSPRRSLTLTDRSNFARPTATRSNRAASPATAKRAGALF